MGYDVSAEDISEALVQMQQEDIVVLEDDAMEDIAGGVEGCSSWKTGMSQKQLPSPRMGKNRKYKTRQVYWLGRRCGIQMQVLRADRVVLEMSCCIIKRVQAVNPFGRY